MADQFNALELLLDDGSLDDPTKRAAMGAQLRRQNAMGVVGQLMGVQPTQMAGQNIQQGAETSLKLAMSQRQAAKEAAARASERQQAQDNWQAQQEREARRDAEQRRQFAQQEARLGANQNAEAKRQWAAATNPVTGESDLYNTITGRWRSEEMGGAQGAGPPGVGAPTGDAVGAAGASGKFTESQRTGAIRAGEGSIALRGALNAGFPDEGRISSLPDAVMGMANRAGFPQAASDRVVQQNTFWSNVADPIVRARTGAAMPIEEFNNQMAMLVPRPGESPKVQMQKANQLVAFLKSGTVGLPRNVQAQLLAEIETTAALIPQSEMEWMQMRAAGKQGQGAQPQRPGQQAPQSGRNFEADPKYSEILGGK